MNYKYTQFSTLNFQLITPQYFNVKNKKNVLNLSENR